MDADKITAFFAAVRETFEPVIRRVLDALRKAFALVVDLILRLQAGVLVAELEMDLRLRSELDADFSLLRLFDG